MISFSLLRIAFEEESVDVDLTAKWRASTLNEAFNATMLAKPSVGESNGDIPIEMNVANPALYLMVPKFRATMNSFLKL